MVGTFNCDLRFFAVPWMEGLDDLLDGSGLGCFRLFGHPTLPDFALRVVRCFIGENTDIAVCGPTAVSNLKLRFSSPLVRGSALAFVYRSLSNVRLLSG